MGPRSIRRDQLLRFRVLLEHRGHGRVDARLELRGILVDRRVHPDAEERLAVRRVAHVDDQRADRILPQHPVRRRLRLQIRVGTAQRRVGDHHVARRGVELGEPARGELAVHCGDDLPVDVLVETRLAVGPDVGLGFREGGRLGLLHADPVFHLLARHREVTGAEQHQNQHDRRAELMASRKGACHPKPPRLPRPGARLCRVCMRLDQ